MQCYFTEILFSYSAVKNYKTENARFKVANTRVYIFWTVYHQDYINHKEKYIYKVTYFQDSVVPVLYAGPCQPERCSQNSDSNFQFLQQCHLQTAEASGDGQMNNLQCCPLECHHEVHLTDLRINLFLVNKNDHVKKQQQMPQLSFV